MSGKAPPRGPRALLGSLAAGPSTPQPSSSIASTSTSPGAVNSKIGAAPPTGPRSLLNGIPSHSRNQAPSKPFANGHAPSSSAGPSTISAPTGPRASQKGKQVEAGWSSSNVGFLFALKFSSSRDTRTTAVGNRELYREYFGIRWGKTAPASQDLLSNNSKDFPDRHTPTTTTTDL
ncbi:hypothetical protein BJ138DRAFT_438844 [Hygrophoropsis aurantiaca]|uniref:Uncharacterized protein n=1 Tax=Hygrophoropsis aurantiaca TaxID=72124 RepID=A0ACB8A3M1_9AGAM|nr:hypothetical protein BJ138DRAFT_438844 [Hygrophoropsis aurantiaca]